MKRVCMLMSLFLIALSSGESLPTMAQTGPFRFKVWTSPAPNRYTAINSTAWNDYQTWAGRAMQSIQGSQRNIGDPSQDPGAYLSLTSIMPRHWAVSENPSWRGRLNPTGEFEGQYGNAMHFVLHVQGDGAVQFKYEDISWCVWRTGQKGGVVCNTMKEVRPASAGAWDRIDCAFGTGYDWGADNKKGGGDDTEVCGGTQTNRGNYDTTLVDEVFYVGASFASAADYRYNKPSEYPDFADWTLQDHYNEFCQFYNTDAGYKEIGLEFTIVASDGNTYNYVAKRSNPQFGLNMQPGLCIPKPESQALESGAKPASQATPLPAPAIHTCALLAEQGYTITTRYGLGSGVQCTRVGADAIGIQSVIDAGLIDAIDVWGYAEQGVEVCIPTHGSSGVLLFLDASASPRSVHPLESTLRGGSICGSVSGPGTIAFVRSWAGAPDPVSADSASVALQDCMVTTTALLNFRDGPAGDIIGFVPRNASLTVLARTDDWFQVDNNGVAGWISANYATTSGSCDEG